MKNLKHQTFLDESGTTKLAVKILAAYFIVYYGIPLLLVVIFGPSLDAILRYPPSYFRGFILILSMFLLTWLLIVQLGKYGARFKLPRLSILFHPLTSLALAGLFILLSVYFWYNFGLQFRQTGERIGETGSLGILIPLYVLRAYFSEGQAHSSLFCFLFWNSMLPNFLNGLTHIE